MKKSKLKKLLERRRIDDEILRAIAHSSAPEYDLVVNPKTHETERVMRPQRYEVREYAN